MKSGSIGVGLAAWAGALLSSLCCLLPLVVIVLGLGSGAFDCSALNSRGRRSNYREVQATLDARWRLVGKDGNELALKRSTINEPVAGQGYPALVQGMNRLLSSLAREIASEIRSRADTSARSQS